MTRQDVADYLSLTVERVLTHFRQRGSITLLSARQVQLQKPRALRAMLQ